MTRYYSEKLSALRLKSVYDIAPPRVRKYLDAEVEFVVERVEGSDLVLELGCGYGRAIPRLCSVAGFVVGMDSARESLLLGLDLYRDLKNFSFVCMDAVDQGFGPGTFDAVVCIQNGISAFHVDHRRLIEESLRIARNGGLLLFSSYSEKFWDARLDWFERQSEAGLLGEIDRKKTGDGNIVCTDGFTATTFDADRFTNLTDSLGLHAKIVEVDASSVFCEISVPAEPSSSHSTSGRKSS